MDFGLKVNNTNCCFTFQIKALLTKGFKSSNALIPHTYSPHVIDLRVLKCSSESSIFYNIPKDDLLYPKKIKYNKFDLLTQTVVWIKDFKWKQTFSNSNKVWWFIKYKRILPADYHGYCKILSWLLVLTHVNLFNFIFIAFKQYFVFIYNSSFRNKKNSEFMFFSVSMK